MKKTVSLLIAVLLLSVMIVSACSTRKLTVAIEASYPPFEQLNAQTGKVEGLSVDLMNAIAARAGLDIEYVNVSFDKVLEGVATCKYDLGSSSISITEERKKVMLFSDPINSGGQVVVVRADNTDIKSKDDLSGKTVAAQAAATSSIEAGKIANVKLQASASIGQVFQDLLDKKVDAVIADNMVSAFFMSRNPGKLKQAGGIFTDEKDGIAICKKNEYLLPEINAALKSLKDDGTVEKLKNKWLNGK